MEQLRKEQIDTICIPQLRHFAELVAEECAKVAEKTYGEAGYSDAAADTIRAKFKEPTNG